MYSANAGVATCLSPRHQDTIPSEALATAGVRIGDPLKVGARANGEIVLIRDEDALERHAGSLSGFYPPGELDQLRSEWD